jgi:hypothetical protein
MSHSDAFAAHRDRTLIQGASRGPLGAMDDQAGGSSRGWGPKGSGCKSTPLKRARGACCTMT